MENWGPLIPVIGAIVVFVITTLLARQRGLPELSKEADAIEQRVISNLKLELESANKKIADCQPRMERAEARIHELEEEILRKNLTIGRLFERLEKVEREVKKYDNA